MILDWLRKQFPEPDRPHDDCTVDELVAETKRNVRELDRIQDELAREASRHKNAATALLEARRRVMGR